MEDDDGPFIPGIHNYCDRWCERCRFTHRCRVFATEQKRLERHLLRGEDPDSIEVVMRDVSEAFGEAMQMLQQMAAERGIDLEAAAAEVEMEEEEDDLGLEADGAEEGEAEFSALPPPGRRRRLRPENHPLSMRAERWSKRVGALLERVRTDIPGIGHDLAQLTQEMTEQEQEETLQRLEAVGDAYEVLLQDHLFVLVKLMRATGSLLDAEAEENEMLAGGEVLPTFSSDTLGVESLALCRDGRTRLLLANLTPAPRRVIVRGLPPRIRARRLGETNAKEATRAPEAFRARPGDTVETAAGDLALDLLPFALARIDCGASDTD